MRLLALAASHRADSVNVALLEKALAHLQSSHPGVVVTTHPFSFFDLPLFNDAQRLSQGMPARADVLKEVFASADALVIASPEYNWSVPAYLKNLLDWISCYRPVPLVDKPVFLMCATPSQRGGVMGLAHLKTVMEALGALPFPTMMTLGRAPESLHDPAKITQLHTQLDAFMAYAKRMTSSF